MTKLFSFVIILFAFSIHGQGIKSNSIKLPYRLGSTFHICRRNPNSDQQNFWICSSPDKVPINRTPAPTFPNYDPSSTSSPYDPSPSSTTTSSPYQPISSSTNNPNNLPYPYPSSTSDPNRDSNSPSTSTTDNPYSSTTDNPYSSTTDNPYSSTTDNPYSSTTDNPYSSTTDNPYSSTTDNPYNSATSTTTNNPFSSTLSTTTSNPYTTPSPSTTTTTNYSPTTTTPCSTSYTPPHSSTTDYTPEEPWVTTTGPTTDPTTGPTTTTTQYNNISDPNEQLSVTELASGEKVFVGQLIFADDFDKFDLKTWDHENTMSGGGSWEFQIYQNNRSNSYVKDGRLHIKPTLTADKYGEEFLSTGTLSLYGGSDADQCTNQLNFGCERYGSATQYLPPILSARVRTMKSFAFKYGRVEIRAKLPAGDWLYPGIYLLPLRNAYGTWPASGEIDIIESRGNKNLFDSSNVNIGVEQMSSKLYFGPYPSATSTRISHFLKNRQTGDDYSQDFHVYELEWTPDAITFKVDKEEIGSVQPSEQGFWELVGLENNTTVENQWQYAENKRMAPFDQEFYIAMNVAVGGIAGYFQDGSTGSVKPWSNQSPQAYKDFWDGRDNWLPTWKGEDAALIVDYVRVYAV